MGYGSLIWPISHVQWPTQPTLSPRTPTIAHEDISCPAGTKKPAFRPVSARDHMPPSGTYTFWRERPFFIFNFKYSCDLQVQWINFKQTHVFPDTSVTLLSPHATCQSQSLQIIKLSIITLIFPTIHHIRISILLQLQPEPETQHIHQIQV